MNEEILEILASINFNLQEQTKLMLENHARMRRIAEFISIMLEKKAIDRAIGEALINVLIDE